MFLRIFVLFVVVVVVVLSIVKRILSVFEGKCYKIMMFVCFFFEFSLSSFNVLFRFLLSFH